MAEQVKKASHYQNENPLYEVWRVIRAWKLNFNKGSAVKYIARAGKKDDEIMELEKAKEFLDFEIQAIKEQRAKEAGNKKPFEKADVKQGKGKVIEIIAPVGTSPEDLIQLAIREIYGFK